MTDDVLYRLPGAPQPQSRADVLYNNLVPDWLKQTVNPPAPPVMPATPGKMPEDRNPLVGAIPDAASAAQWLVPEAKAAGAATMMKGIFAGPLAKTANQRKLLDAMQSELNGVKGRQIWNETGWFRGPDNEWRFEIPDTNAQVHPQPPLRETPATLGEVLIHPELYKAYPELQKMSTAIRGGSGGAFFPHEKHIAIGESELKGPETTLHEVQHAIQGIENFARGGQPKGGNTKEEIERALRSYRSLSGEVESRNVEDRYGVDQRFPHMGVYKIPPWETEDTLRSNQSVFKEPVFAGPYEYTTSTGQRYRTNSQKVPSGK